MTQLLSRPRNQPVSQIPARARQQACQCTRTAGRSRTAPQPDGHRRRPRWRVALALLPLLVVGCAASSTVTNVTPGTPLQPDRSLVVGRIELFKSGHQLHPDRPSPTGTGPIGGLSFHNLVTGEFTSYRINDPLGRFEIVLPPGRYGLGIQYYIYLSDTPARFEVPQAGQQYYVGTLRANFFARSSLGGAWTTTFGGILPMKDTDFAVVDEWEWAQQHRIAPASDGAPPERHVMVLRAQ